MDFKYQTQSIKPLFNPQAVVDYYNNTDGSGGTRKDMKELVLKAKQHLVAVGWSLRHLVRECGKREPRYWSPVGNKKYLSVRAACKACLDGQEVEELGGLKGEVVNNDVDVYVPGCSGVERGKREFWIDLFEDSGRRDVVSDLEDGSVDDTGREECELSEGGKKRKIGGEEMNDFDELKKSTGGDSYLSEGPKGEDCKAATRVLRRRTCVNSGKVTETLEDRNDDVCSVCREGGDLMLCDQCPSAFHAPCLGLSEIPAGEFWYCRSCSCGICGQSVCRDDQFMRDKQCDQCEQHYHVKCIGGYRAGKLERNKWFCSKRCQNIHSGLKRLLGKPIVVDGNNLTWTLLKNNISVDDPKTKKKLKRALVVMHECFKPVAEPWRGRDVGEAVIFSRKSDLKQLDFKGFYTVILQKGNRVVTFATVRVFGDKVAEIPFIATRFNYRRQGMCKTLMNVLEEKLINLGVKKVVLPAMPSVLDTWTSPSFAFREMTTSDRSMLLGYTFLEFPGTIACQKLLQRSDDNL
ncbi:hypothetical protein DCAR_0314043 [Daucus carota subsp. sativus]|uniref:PHD-type domain-containing protein n=1 Tax=Daucus carota subsp. sativus TaxID=79200 RepID=A0AAF0WT51_DAUCS|nr:hypothetical protein DCAR_0314043 [Daucus carota subsp. sativus]